MKTKRLIVAIALLLVCSLQQAYSQSPVYIGLQGGISIPNLHSSSDGPEVARGYSSRLGPYFGVFGEFTVSPKFSIQPEVNYSSQGGKKNAQTTHSFPAQAVNPQAPPGTFYYANVHYKNEAKLNYIQVPVLAKFTFPFGNGFNFIVDAGPYAGFLLSAKNVTTGHAQVYMDEQLTQPLPGGEQAIDSTDNIKDQLHTANFGIQGGVGLAYTVGKGYFFIHAGGNYGFIKIQKDKQNGEDNTGAATVTLGYALKLY